MMQQNGNYEQLVDQITDMVLAKLNGEEYCPTFCHADVQRIELLYVRAGLPVCGPQLAAERYLELMQHDKKVQNGRLRLILLKQLGEGCIDDSATTEEISAAILARLT